MIEIIISASKIFLVNLYNFHTFYNDSNSLLTFLTREL